MRAWTRRDALTIGCWGTIAFAASGVALATPSEAQAEIAKFTGGKTPEPGRISIELPEIAENGNTVPLSIAVESPMTPQDHVTDVLVIADANPNPRLASLHFTPLSGRAEAALRIRLAATENVIVVAKTGDGKFYAARKEVKVTIGGCGG